MATPQELQNALMLKKTQGLTTEQAVNQSRVPVTVTSQINQDRLKNNQSRVQAEIQAGTRPEVGTSVTPQAGQTQAPTPVLPTAPTTTPSGATLSADGTVTPATPAPATETTPTPAPETPKVETPAPTTPVTPTAVTPVVDKNAEIKAKNEAKLAENQQKAKLAEEQRQKGITEQNTALANNEGAILNTLKTGGMIPESVKTSPFYKSAQQTYNKLQQYSTYSTNELVTAMNQGSIVPGTNVYNEMMKDPAMKQKLTDAQVYRAGNPVNSTQIYENASSDILSNNHTTANYLADGVITQEEYDQATNNTQVVAKAKEVEEKANKYNTLKAEYDSIEDEVNAQFPGSPFADSIIADRQKAKYKNLVLAKGEWETATGTLTELKSQASTLFETNLNLAEKRREEENQIKAEERSVQRSKDALQYEADFNKKQAEAALNDPATAIPKIIGQYAQLGVLASKSEQQHISDAKAFIANGGTLGEYISQMQKDFQAKDAYKAKFAPKATENYELKEVGGKTYKFNQATGQYEILSGGATSTGTSSTYLNVPRTGNNVGKDTNNPGNIMGDSEAQRNLALKYGAMGFYKSPNGRTYAVFPDMQTGINASMSDLQSKLSGGSSWATPNTTLEKFASGWVSGPNAPINQNAVANYVKLTGYPKNTPISQIPMDVLSKAIFANEGVDISKSADLSSLIGTGTQGTQGTYTDQNINDLAYLTELQEKNPTQAAKDMKELGYTARDLANYKAGNVPLTEKQKTTSTDIMSAIKDLTDSDKYEWNDAVGKFDPTRIIGTQDAEDATIAINNLIAKLTLPNLGVLKGPMSDKDIQFIKEASSKLATTQSNDSFERNLIDAYNLAARRAGQKEITKLSDLKSTKTNTVGGELNYSKYE